MCGGACMCFCPHVKKPQNDSLQKQDSSRTGSAGTSKWAEGKEQGLGRFDSINPINQKIPRVP